MRDPYKLRRDLSRIGPVVLGLLVLITGVLVAVYVFRPASSAAEGKAAIALEQEMDRNAAISNARREKAEAGRQADFQ